MLNFSRQQRLSIDLDSPLHVSKFFNVGGSHYETRQKRQQLIVGCASEWLKLLSKGGRKAHHVPQQVFLTKYTYDLRDARSIIDHFFQVTEVGHNIRGDIASSQMVPKRLGEAETLAIKNFFESMDAFQPGIEPVHDKSLTCSRVKIQFAPDAVDKLKRIGRHDLIPEVKYVLSNEYLNFYFARAGAVQARDKSVWPIVGIEQWPGWLRESLFGMCVDIDNAYVQFLVTHLEQIHADNPARMALMYPDLPRMIYEKELFRHDVCVNILKLPFTDENVKVVKALVMSLANGSRISERLMHVSKNQTEAVKIVIQHCGNRSIDELSEIGRKLGFIMKQFKSANRELKSHGRVSDSVFHAYLKWERDARYKIWTSLGCQGIMMHDGLDGVVSSLDSNSLRRFVQETTGIRVTVS